MHDALFYDDAEAYVALIRQFALEGVDAAEPVLIAAPEPRLDLLRRALGCADGAVSFVDMREEGRNPGRVIPLIRAFLDEHAGRRARLVGEPFWPGRTLPETVETHRHEALINAAFDDDDVHIVCPYDTGELDPMVIEDAKRTHPTLVADGRRHASECFVDPLLVYAAAERPLPEPPADPMRIDLAGLTRFRRDVERLASPRLEGERLADLVSAANEAAANSLTHGGGGTARVWSDGSSVVVELRDGGIIQDPLVGRGLPEPFQESGRGLWLMHQLCDLVEVRSDEHGTVVRMHMSLG